MEITSRASFTLPKAAATTLTERLAEARQKKLESDKTVLTALQTASKKRNDDAKALAKQTVEAIKQRLKILESLFAGDPEKMAKAIAQVAKELKAAVKAYAQAGGSSADVGISTPQTSPNSGETPTPEPDAESAAELGTEVTNEDTTPPEASAKETPTNPNPYAKSPDTQKTDTQKTEAEKAEAKDAVDFAKDVRDLMHKIKTLLERARAEAKLQPESHDATNKEAFEAADEALKALDKDLSDLEQSRGQALFTSGLMVSLQV